MDARAAHLHRRRSGDAGRIRAARSGPAACSVAGGTADLRDGRFPTVSVLALVGFAVCVWRFRRSETARAVLGVGPLSMPPSSAGRRWCRQYSNRSGCTDLFLRRYVTGVHRGHLPRGEFGRAELGRRRCTWSGPARPAEAGVRRCCVVVRVGRVCGPLWRSATPMECSGRRADGRANCPVDGGSRLRLARGHGQGDRARPITAACGPTAPPKNRLRPGVRRPANWTATPSTSPPRGR